MSEQARRATPPNRDRHPAGCSFASGCSPPHLMVTQLPSASCATTSHRMDFHPPDKATSQTHPPRQSRGVSRLTLGGKRRALKAIKNFLTNKPMVLIMFSPVAMDNRPCPLPSNCPDPAWRLLDRSLAALRVEKSLMLIIAPGPRRGRVQAFDWQRLRKAKGREVARLGPAQADAMTRWKWRRKLLER